MRRGENAKQRESETGMVERWVCFMEFTTAEVKCRREGCCKFWTNNKKKKKKGKQTQRSTCLLIMPLKGDPGFPSLSMQVAASHAAHSLRRSEDQALGNGRVEI